MSRNTFRLLRDVPSHDGRPQHVKAYAEQKRILPEWYSQQWRTAFSSPFGHDSLVVIGKLLKAEEKEGIIYFTVEVQDDSRSARPLIATFVGPFWHFSPVMPSEKGNEKGGKM